MTVDIIVVTVKVGAFGSTSSFSQEVLRQIQNQERQGYTCEVKYATSEGRHDGDVVHSAMIHVYETE